MDSPVTTNSIRRRFLTEWAILVTALMLLAFFVGTSLWHEHADIEAHERDRLASHVNIVDRNLGRTLRSIDRTLIGIRDDLPGWHMANDKLQGAARRLRAFATALPSVRSLLVTDADGRAPAVGHAVPPVPTIAI